VHINFFENHCYAVDVFPLIVLAETQLGPGGGETKKAYVRMSWRHHSRHVYAICGRR